MRAFYFPAGIVEVLASTLIEMKVDINVKDYTGATPLNHALNYYKTHPIATKLIERGALLNANPFYLYNAFKLLGIKWLTPEMKTTPFLHAQWKEMNIGKLCSHIFDIKGVTELIPMKSNDNEAISFHREGMISPRWLIKKIGKITSKMTGINNNLTQMISSLCAFSADSMHTNGDYLARINEDKPVLVMASTKNHSYNILFYKDAFVVCDGNSKTIDIKRFQRNLLTEEIIGKLRYDCSFVDSKKAAKVVMDSVEVALQVKNENCDLGMISDFWASQTIGNCCYKSFEMAVHALALIENEPVNYFIPIWLLELKIQLTSQYLSQVQKGLFQPDQFLIHTMIQDLEKRKNYSYEETFSKIDAICDACRKLFDPEKYKNGLISEIIKKAEESSFSHFMDIPIPSSLHYYGLLT